MRYTVHVDMLDCDGNWKDSATSTFPVVPVTGDFITLSLGTWEVIKRVIHAGTDDLIVADITVRQVM